MVRLKTKRWKPKRLNVGRLPSLGATKLQTKHAVLRPQAPSPRPLPPGARRRRLPRAAAAPGRQVQREEQLQCRQHRRQVQARQHQACRRRSEAAGVVPPSMHILGIVAIFNSMSTDASGMYAERVCVQPVKRHWSLLTHSLTLPSPVTKSAFREGWFKTFCERCIHDGNFFFFLTAFTYFMLVVCVVHLSCRSRRITVSRGQT